MGLRLGRPRCVQACAALSTLHAQGGVPRFYQGVGWALLNTPLARFGDTAANTGVLALLGALGTRHWMPISVRTLFASAAAVSPFAGFCMQK